MTSAADPRGAMTTIEATVRRTGKHMGYVAIVLGALVAYCELCRVVTGNASRGFAGSLGWAIQVSAGWIVMGAVLWRFGEAFSSRPMFRRYPRTTVAVAISSIALFALSCEVLMAVAAHTEEDLPALLYERAPLAFACAALLFAVSCGKHLLKQPTHSASDRWIDPRSEAVQARGLPLDDTRRGPELIEVMTGTGHTTIRTADIECLEADRNYINVIHRSGRTYLLRQTMAAAERSLNAAQFMRVHRSTIVNVECIKERRAGNVLVLHSGRTVKIGRAFRERTLRVGRDAI